MLKKEHNKMTYMYEISRIDDVYARNKFHVYGVSLYT